MCKLVLKVLNVLGLLWYYVSTFLLLVFYLIHIINCLKICFTFKSKNYNTDRCVFFKHCLKQTTSYNKSFSQFHCFSVLKVNPIKCLDLVFNIFIFTKYLNYFIGEVDLVAAPIFFTQHETVAADFLELLKYTNHCLSNSCNIGVLNCLTINFRWKSNSALI